MILTVLSTAEFALLPARTPRGIDNMRSIIAAVRISSIVAGRYSSTSNRTFLCVKSDSPQFPVKIPPSQYTYWTYNG